MPTEEWRNPDADKVPMVYVGHPTTVAMMGHLLVADRIWSGCTKPQRALLAELCAPVAATLIERGYATIGDLPYLPNTVRKSTRDALDRRGLVDAQTGRVRGKAVYAYWWTIGRSTGGES